MAKVGNKVVVKLEGHHGIKAICRPVTISHRDNRPFDSNQELPGVVWVQGWSVVA